MKQKEHEIVLLQFSFCCELLFVAPDACGQSRTSESPTSRI